MRAVSLSLERPAFEYFEDLMSNQVKVADPVINERVFILEHKLNEKKSQYVFSFLVKSADRISEVKLSQQDVAMITALSMTIQKVKEVDGQIIPLSPEMTFADSAVFTGAKDGEREVDAVAALFAGKLTLDNKVWKRFADFDTRNLLCTPETKVSGNPSYGIGIEAKGYYPLVQPFVINGSTENKLILDLPYLLPKAIEGGIAANGDALIDGSYNIVRMRCRGLVCMDADVQYSQFLNDKRNRN
jgi:hypothetical protein